MEFNYLITDRLKLRIITPTVLQYVYHNYTDEQLIIFLGLPNAEQLAIEKSKFEKGYTTYKIDYIGSQLLDKTNLNVIGWCGFHSWYPEHQRAEIGYHIIEETNKGKGYMSEAFGAIINYGFQHMQLNRIEALIGPQNIASLQLVHKFGFVKEGVMRQHYFKNGQLEDSIIYALLKADYLK
jgi:ribosomal-protein-alanine N-acetyltransferase